MIGFGVGDSCGLASVIDHNVDVHNDNRDHSGTAVDSTCRIIA